MKNLAENCKLAGASRGLGEPAVEALRARSAGSRWPPRSAAGHTVPLAQHSAAVYEADARAPAAEVGVELVCSSNWGQNAKLCEAFASRIVTAIAQSPAPEQTTIVMTAHSLPKFVILGGDPYEREVGAAVRAITAAVKSRVARVVRVALAFQGQALSGPGSDGRSIEWIGPDLREAFGDIARRNDRHAIVAPVGFLADHVEILYDLDIEARRLAADFGLTFDRVPSLNASRRLRRRTRGHRAAAHRAWMTGRAFRISRLSEAGSRVWPRRIPRQRVRVKSGVGCR